MTFAKLTFLALIVTFCLFLAGVIPGLVPLVLVLILVGIGLAKLLIGGVVVAAVAYQEVKKAQKPAPKVMRGRRVQ